MRYVLLVLLLGSCSVDVHDFGGNALGGAGVLVRGAAGEIGVSEAAGATGAGGLAGSAGGKGGGVALVASTGGDAGGSPGTGGVVGSGGVSTGGATATGGTGATGGMAVSTGGVTATGGHLTTMADCYNTNTSWDGQNDALMRPGSSCNNCHQFTVAGTVFIVPHDPDNCFGVNGTANSISVLVHGADDKAIALKVNESGNFWTSAAVAFPATVSTIYGSGQLTMQAKVMLPTGGDCNSCHTSDGFPGRVLVP